jgi:hypothetical protein
MPVLNAYRNKEPEGKSKLQLAASLVCATSYRLSGEGELIEQQ